MAIAGTVVHPFANLSPIVGELIAQKMSQMPAYRAAQLAAPIIGRRARNGTYVTDQTFRGINLQAAPSALTPKSLYSTEYESQGVAYGTGSFAIKTYKVDQQDIPDAEIGDWLEIAGVSVEDRVATLIAERVAAAHASLTWSALGTSGNYTSGFSLDPGNITSASFNLIGLLQTVRTLLIKSQAWMPGMPIDVFIADDVYQYIQLLDQSRARIVSGMSATNTIATPDMVDALFAAYLKGSQVHDVVSYYTETTGVVTADFSGKILFKPRRDAWSGAFATLAPEGSGGGVSVASVRSKRIEEMPGTRLFGDGHMDIKVLNASGAVLAYNLLS